MKLKKILLIALAVSSMFFTVNASALEDTENQQKQQESTTTKSLANITEEEFKKIVPESFNVNFTRSEHANAVYESELKKDDKRLNALNLDALEDEFKKQLDKVFEENGYSTNEKVENADYYVDLTLFSLFSPKEDIVSVSLVKDIGKNFQIKDVYTINAKINYAKEPNYNEQDAAYVKKAIENIKLKTYKDGYYSFVTSENSNDILDTFATDEQLKNKILPYDNLLDDKSIVIKPVPYFNDYNWKFDDEYLSYYDMSLNFYKNDVLYETKIVRVGTMYGVTLGNGTMVNIRPIEKSDKTYTEMVSKLKKDGYNTAINGYELKAYGSTTKGMKFTLNVDKKYNGKNVVVLHKKANGTYETLKGTVKDGKVTITVDELSPFMIALDDRTIVTKILNQKSIAIAIVVILLLLVILVVKSKKKAA